MVDISIQFHALPEELLCFVNQCVADYKLYIIAVRFPPYAAIELDASQLDEAFADSSPYHQLTFTLHKPRLPAKGNLELWKKNPDALNLQFSARIEKGLVESGLFTRTENAAALVIWKKVTKRLKDLTEKGALAVQPDTGATGPARGHRYTLGAKALEASGVPMLTVTGIILKLGHSVN